MDAGRAVVPAALDGERLDRVVAMLVSVSRAEAATLVADGAVRVDGEVARSRSRRVREGDVLTVDVATAPSPVPGPDPSVRVTVLHEDHDLIVVDKPAGLVVHPGAGHTEGTLVHGLLARYPELARVGPPQRPGIVHRLDAGTSGVLAVARSERARVALIEQLASRTAGRRYQALVWGAVADEAGAVDAPIGRSRRDPTRMAVSADGRQARTRFRVRQRYSVPRPLTLLDCELETGRTHQIRVHLAAIGHPVVGDRRYGGARAGLDASRPMLHAEVLELDHPATGERMRFHAPVPDDMAGVLRTLS